MQSANRSVTIFSQILLWSGAAISIAEIMAGALLAPLGFYQGLSAILLGHLIGAILLYLAGLIGANSRLAAAQSAAISFGRYGSKLFALLNVLQLIGWTAVMIIVAARAFEQILAPQVLFSNLIWCAVIGLLVLCWLLLGPRQWQIVNLAVVSALLLFLLLISTILLQHPSFNNIISDDIRFGGAVELNVAMALSWLPLIADYTRKLPSAKRGTLSSTLAYSLTSVLMFVIGLLTAIYAGTTDLIAIFVQHRLSLIALFVVLFSTVTTTYLDVYSAGVCLHTLWPKLTEKPAAVIATLLGTTLAMMVSMEAYQDFLYLIGSAFAPAFAILFVDYYLLQRKQTWQQSVNLKNSLLWCIGVLLYQSLLTVNCALGATLPVMLIIAACSWLIERLLMRK